MRLRYLSVLMGCRGVICLFLISALNLVFAFRVSRALDLLVDQDHWELLLVPEAQT